MEVVWNTCDKELGGEIKSAPGDAEESASEQW